MELLLGIMATGAGSYFTRPRVPVTYGTNRNRNLVKIQIKLEFIFADLRYRGAPRVSSDRGSHVEDRMRGWRGYSWLVMICALSSSTNVDVTDQYRFHIGVINRVLREWRARVAWCVLEFDLNVSIAISAPSSYVHSDMVDFTSDDLRKIVESAMSNGDDDMLRETVIGG